MSQSGAAFGLDAREFSQYSGRIGRFQFV